MIDFHCHLDLHADFAAAIASRENVGIYTLSVTTTPHAWPRNLELTKDKRYIRAALGIHPQLVGTRGSEIELWKRYLPETRYVGEVGLDAGPQHRGSLTLQREIFSEVLRSCAAAGDKILSVHSVRATKEVLKLISEYLPSDRGRVVLHWFTGTKNEIQYAVDLGCYFSFNADMLLRDRGRSVAGWVPRERILTESDAPFTRTPDIRRALELLADNLGVSDAEMSKIIVANLKRLLLTGTSSSGGDVDSANRDLLSDFHNPI